MSDDQSSEARSSNDPIVCDKRLPAPQKGRCKRVAGHEGECSRYAEDDEPSDLPVATVTVTLTKFGTDAPVEHATRLLIRESHLEAIQRKHGLSLIKWLETALEIELEALTDGSQG